MGDNITNVDTSKFRLATWNYIHLLYGIFHDDYAYNEVIVTLIFKYLLLVFQWSQKYAYTDVIFVKERKKIKSFLVF